MATDCIAQVTFELRSEKEAGGRRLRRGARQLRRRRDLAQGDRYPARADQALGRVPGRSAAAGQGPASDARVAPATGLRARLWLRRLQRRRAGRGRRDPQTAGRPRSDRGAGLGFAAHALAVRECGGVARVARDGAGAGRHRRRAPSPPAQGPGPAHHDRPRSDRRPDPRPAGADLLQWPLRHLVLSAGRRHGDLRRRGGAVCRRRRAAARQRAGQPRGPGALAAPDSAAARGLSSRPRSECASMGASRRPRCSRSSRPRRSSTSWRWRATPGWRSGPDG